MRSALALARSCVCRRAPSPLRQPARIVAFSVLCAPGARHPCMCILALPDLQMLVAGRTRSTRVAGGSRASWRGRRCWHGWSQWGGGSQRRCSRHATGAEHSKPCSDSEHGLHARAVRTVLAGGHRSGAGGRVCVRKGAGSQAHFRGGGAHVPVCAATAACHCAKTG